MNIAARILLFPFKALGFLVSLVPEIKLGKPFGIPLVITRSFLFYYAMLCWAGGVELGAIIAIAYTLVIIHEFSHAFAASRFGHKTVSVKIWPMSGVASIDGDWGTDYKQEFWIAVAGPLSNIFMALALWPLTGYGNRWINEAFELNITLAAFNIIPVSPMDGGRVFHAFLLSCLKDVKRTAKWSAICSLVFAAIAAPFLWNWSPVAAVMVCIMVGVGCAEQRALVDLEKNKADKKRRVKELLDSMAGLLDVEKRLCLLNDHMSRAIEIVHMEQRLERAVALFEMDKVDEAKEIANGVRDKILAQSEIVYELEAKRRARNAV